MKILLSVVVLLTAALIGFTNAGPSVLRKGTADLIYLVKTNGFVETLNVHYIWDYDLKCTRASFFNGTNVGLQIINATGNQLTEWVAQNDSVCSKRSAPNPGQSIDFNIAFANATSTGAVYIRNQYTLKWTIGNEYQTQSIWVNPTTQAILRWEVNVTVNGFNYYYSLADLFYVSNYPNIDPIVFQPPPYCNLPRDSKSSKIKVNNEGEKGWGREQSKITNNDEQKQTRSKRSIPDFMADELPFVYSYIVHNHP
eukprot:TRINITY_DN2296_c0_g1_i1.p1 TRINITY_DN2296_c0_g1~~TRINITY_DN2296_c0_g1_i1.p1  ORF type:complete len:254 (-),score=54.95 TRINITY_DN2296_c0_g1_i1:65-826(-)